ncbi:MAG: hypothetical protein OXN17_12840 [Candidatus Poribacteria bacterium]|nr:hypothetical protein [Candidatus Poribacteria bacterium]MDE0502606.1 hypothetical protein [Candidatus Poribacteria bacterium]
MDSVIRLWDVYTGECLRSIGGHTNDIGSLAYSRDGVTLASVG